MDRELSRNHSTRAASKCLEGVGLNRSVSWLEKRRLIGPDDPVIDRGPPWYRDPLTGRVWYPEVELLHYAAHHLAQLQLRQRAPEPLNFQRRRAS